MADSEQEPKYDSASGRSPLSDSTAPTPNAAWPIYRQIPVGPGMSGSVGEIGRWLRHSAAWTSLSRHKALAATLAALLAVVLLVGSAGLAVALHNMFAKPDGYLYTSASSVIFVQITTDQNGHIAGTLQSVSSTASETITTQESAFTGVLNGTQVSLTFSALGLSATVTGTLDGNTLILHVPDANGYMATDVFQGAGVADYNADVAQLRQRTDAYASATQAAEATVSAQQAEAQATASTQAMLDQAVSDANSAVASDLNTLTSDTRSLSHNIDFSSVLGDYGLAWQQMQTDYQREQSDYQKGCGVGGVNAGQVQADAGQVQADLGQVQADDGQLQADETPAQTLVAQINSTSQTLQSDWMTLKSAAANDVGGRVAPQFTASDVNGALASAQTQVKAANSALQSVQQQASQYDSEAAKTATDAQSLANSMSC